LTTLRKAIALLLDQPGLAAAVADRPRDWAELDNPGVSLLRQIIDIVEAYPTITAAALCERWRGTDKEPIVDQLSDSRLIAHIPDDGRSSELIGAIEALNHLAVRERRWRLLSAASIGDLSPEQRARLRGETKTPPELS
jgi:DNA primase